MAKRKVGPFVLESQLGVGGMGVVYRATYEKNGQEVALKLLSPEMAMDEGVRKRFLREMEILKRLKHPNIVRYYGGGSEEGQYYYAMEILDGGSLEDLLKKKKRLSWEQTIKVAKAVTKGLEHAHQQGVIHRDLKPGNLFLTKDGNVKLGDFGIARDTHRTALTAAGKTVGTYAYMAPEQIAGSPPVTRKTDLYALGCVMFQMLAGEAPFQSNNAAEMLMQHLEVMPPRVTTYCHDCPIWLEKVILKLLAKEPDDRYYDALALRSALDKVIQKVAERASVVQQTAAGDRTLVASDEDKRELKKLLGKKKKKKRDHRAFYEKSWFLGICLLLLISVVTWAAWPMSNEERFSRGEALMEQAAEIPPQIAKLSLNHSDDEQISVLKEKRISLLMEARDKYFQPLLESSPDGPHAKEAENYLAQIEIETLSLKIEGRLRRNHEPKTETERSYMEARRAQKARDRITALNRYRSLITLIKDRKSERPYVVLAELRIKEIQASGSGGNLGREIIQDGLAKAAKHLQNGKMIEAEEIYSAIINVYKTNRELAPLVSQARKARQKLQKKEPPVPLPPSM